MFTLHCRRLLTPLLLLAASGPCLAAGDVLINPGDIGERSRYASFSALKAVIDPALRLERLVMATPKMSLDASADLAATRSRTADIFVAPAHVIGSALRYGYLPLATLERPVQAVLVARKDSPASDLAASAGLKLGLPMQDSVVTYLLRGEVNAANTSIKRHFGAVYESRYQDALLVCLQIRRCDVVAVEQALFARWLAAGEPVKALMQSRAVPGMSVAVKPGTAAAAAAPALRAALLAGAAVDHDGAVDAAPFAAAAVEAKAFDYVATLGYFTPRMLPGATVVDAAAAAQLVKAGAIYFDTRTEAEYKAGHAPGSQSLPYLEKSAKDVDYDATQDGFDLKRLPTDRHAALIFACNGAECWKSFKASRAAIKASFTRVHWFRGGLPEWRSAGLKVDVDR